MKFLAEMAFLAYTIIIAAGGIMAVFSASLVRALLGLILTLFGVAGLYLLLSAPFMALMQILIYLGAVVVLIFFAIMLSQAPAGAEERSARPKRQAVLAALAGILPALLLFFPVLTSMPIGRQIPVEVNLARVGEAFLGPYVLAFELISIVLFVAMAGAVLVGFERRRSR